MCVIYLLTPAQSTAHHSDCPSLTGVSQPLNTLSMASAKQTWSWNRKWPSQADGRLTAAAARAGTAHTRVPARPARLALLRPHALGLPSWQAQRRGKAAAARAVARDLAAAAPPAAGAAPAIPTEAYARFASELAAAPDARERSRLLLGYAARLPELSQDERRDANRVMGCTAQARAARLGLGAPGSTTAGPRPPATCPARPRRRSSCPPSGPTRRRAPCAPPPAGLALWSAGPGQRGHGLPR